MKQEEKPQRPVLDDETIAFAGKVFQATREGRIDDLAPLLERRLPPNLRNHKGDSLLMLAAYHGHRDLAQLLLEKGADPELANDRGQTPLAGAIFKGDMPTVRLLLERGANVNGNGEGSQTPLMVAAMFNRVEMVDMLLSYGCDHRVRDARGFTAEAIARAMGAPDTPDRLALLNHDGLPKANE